MSLNPIETVAKLEEQYKEFLSAQFCFRDEELNTAAKKAISLESDLFHGPYIEASMPYKSARTLEKLVADGELNPKIKYAFTDDEFSVYKRYEHQEKALRLVSQGHNIVVSSGTGSGKTECFLIPVLNTLLNEFDNGTLGPGVRAILVYPMNALANDQMDRFRVALKNLPQITFGRYIGETPSGKRKDAEIAYSKTHEGATALPNELLTRDEMHENPPHILVTNYAMLEYMLLRPEVNTIFQGEKAKSFKFLILDEAHTYHGAHGTEVSMLIRRLKERIFEKSDDCMQCIATSATLGGGKDDIVNVVTFANQLFSEKFYAEDIILSERDALAPGENNECPLSLYQELLECYVNNDVKTLRGKINAKGIDLDEIIYNFLINDKFTYELRKVITSEVLTIDELAKKLLPNDNVDQVKVAIVSLVELGSKIKDIKTGLPLINAKYHVFVRSLEGGFVSLYPQKKVFTERHNEYNGAPVYELMNCIRCGQEYIVGSIDQTNEGDDILLPVSDLGRKNEIFMLCNEEHHFVKEDEDEWDAEGEMAEKEIIHFYLCPKCGKLYPSDAKDVECCQAEKVHLLKINEKNSRNLCLQCGRNRAGTLKKMTTGEDASTEILTRTLYQLLPAERKSIKKKIDEQTDSIYGSIYEDFEETNEDVELGRKLLMFSDSRQEAAKFAMFLQGRYNEWLWKNLIWSCVNKLEDGEEVSFDRLVNIVQKEAKRYSLFNVTDTDDDEKSLVATHLMKEFIEFEPRISLSGLGLIDISFNVDVIGEKVFNQFIKYGFTLDEVKNLFRVLFNGLRKQGAIQYPDNVDPADEAFAPRNRIFSFKRQGGEKTSKEETFGWLPSLNRSNRRLDYVKRILLKKNYNEEDATKCAQEILSKIYDERGFVQYFSRLGIIVVNSSNNHVSLNYKNWRFSKPNKRVYVCDKCGATTTINVEDVCDQTNCDGHLIPLNESTSRDYFYRKSYKNMKPIPMIAAEHTAQLQSDWATKVQNDFKDNKINILSCSTTFEMGVDIGSLESVVLRNVPPETANYVQRAGRAGRRNSSAALILTFARRRSHDLTFFAEPQKMIKGIIKAPYLTLDNEYLIKRHLQSIVMAYFFRNHKNYYGFSADRLLFDGYDADQALFAMLQSKPKELLDSMKTVLPNKARGLFNLDAWEWTKELANNRQDNDALFDNAVRAYKDELCELEDLIKKYVEEQKFGGAEYAKGLVKSHKEQELIGFLSLYGIVPRYGFPVDVVPLKIKDHSVEAKRIDLSRDLRMAITEYGPNSEVVAGNRIWRPYALRTQGNKKWPTMDIAICSVCGKIHSFNTVLGEEAANRIDKCCNKKLTYAQVVKPIFGFTTKESLGKSNKKSNDAAHYSSTSYFEGFADKNLIIKKDLEVGGKIVETQCAPQGKMLVINNGLFASGSKMGQKFKICPVCGYMTTGDFVKTHQRADGKDCGGALKLAYLGHNFNTDVLLIELPMLENSDVDLPSLLYAIIEGASNSLDIDRRELGGAVWGYNDRKISLVIYDTVPGGAGHVKKVQTNILDTIKGALLKVSGQCGCGEETSCYGCLRNYDNQTYHDTMSRKGAKKYLEMLLGK